MNRSSRFWRLSALCALLVIGLATPLLLRLYHFGDWYQNLIALSWGDSTYAPALYRAEVYTQSSAGEQLAMARIYIDRPGLWVSASHGPITLGRVKNHQEAVSRWGQISWSVEGVRFGQGHEGLLVPRAELENHR